MTTDKIAKHLFPLTPEEQSLLDLYSEVRALEKLAAQARSDASKAVLVAADEEYQRKAGRDAHDEGEGIDDNIDSASVYQDMKPKERKSKKHKRHKRSKIQENSNAAASDGSSVDGVDDEEDDVSSDENNDENDKSEKERLRQLKLNRLRDSVQEGLKEEEENEKTLQEQEDHRKQFLVESGAADDSTVIKRKKRNFHTLDQDQAPSLLANMNHSTTPPHDFSKSLNMSRITGQQLFPQITPSPSELVWSPPDDAHAPDEGCLELELPNFNLNEAAEGRGNNTIAIKFAAPKDSRRFSINIAGPGHSNYYSVLFHFNPRQFEKGGQVVINDKKSGTWGQGINIPISTFPLMFGETSSLLIVQITGDGFDVFMNDQHCARLEHRVPLPNKSSSLMLQFPSTDDYGHTENWSVFKVWWGNKESMVGDNTSHIPGVNIQSSLHDKKLFISGLPKISTEPQVELRRAELERAFRKYGGALGVTVTCPPNCSFAFVEVESYRAADMAIREMSSKYTVNRARRSRHDALMEQRESAEAGNTKSNDDGDWN